MSIRLLYGIIGHVKGLTIRRRTKFDVQLTYDDMGRPKNIRIKLSWTGDPFSVGMCHDLRLATTSTKIFGVFLSQTHSSLNIVLRV